MKLKCGYKNCNYKWDYNGESDFFASCPNCLRKVKINKKVKIKVKINKTKKKVGKPMKKK